MNAEAPVSISGSGCCCCSRYPARPDVQRKHRRNSYNGLRRKLRRTGTCSFFSGAITWIIGVSDASSISIGRILSPMMWFGHVRTEQPLLSDTRPIRQRRLSFFGHLCHADIGQEHSRALRACIRGPPKDWRRRTGRPRQTWLRTIEDDLRPLNFGLATARRRAMDRPACGYTCS